MRICWAAATSSAWSDGADLSVRELVVLGTASQVPTRHRNHNGYLLRWDGEGLLFDPGEERSGRCCAPGSPPMT